MCQLQDLKWVALIVDHFGLDLSHTQCRYIVHQTIFDRGQKEKTALQNGTKLEMTKDRECMDYLLSTKFGPQLLKEKEEAYGNTPLHIAVSLPSLFYARIIVKY